ncbi:MAG: UDP-2,3-diacylglucosamine diphosphatase [Campylobacter sp.]
MDNIIKNGAVFIADAHENANRNSFNLFLNLIKSEEIRPTQLFLMGDMFDFIASQTDFFVDFFKKEIELLNELAEKIDIYYFEGNHDYNLSSLLKNIKIYPINSQPAMFKTLFGDSVAIAHGDMFLPFFTKYSLLFLRTNFFLKTINFVDNVLNNKISKLILAKLADKKLDYEIENFEKIAKKRCSFYNAKIVIEGHFHQGKSFEFISPKKQFYINISSFACKQRFFIVKYDKQKFSLSEMDVRGQNV